MFSSTPSQSLFGSSSSPSPIFDVPEQNEVLNSRPAVPAIMDEFETLFQPLSDTVAEEVSLSSLGRNSDAKRKRDAVVSFKGVDFTVLDENLTAVQLVQDLTDEDTVDENDEPAPILVDVLVDTNEPNGATYRQSPPQIRGPYWMSLSLVLIPASGITAPLECHPFSVVRIDECLSSLDFVMIVEKNEKFSSCSPAMNSISCLETIGDAEEMFLKMLERNIVLWNTLISALVRIGQEEKEMAVFDAMVSEGVVPPNSTLEKMEVVGKEEEKGCALLCMYSKCGKIELEKNFYLINNYGDLVSLLELDQNKTIRSGFKFCLWDYL